MGKGKKKQSKTDKVAGDILDVAAASVKKFRKVTRQIAKLSTGQKLVGGIALAAAGLTYLARQEFSADKPAPGGDAGADQAGHPHPARDPLALAAAPADDAADAPARKPAAPRKNRKAKHDG